MGEENKAFGHAIWCILCEEQMEVVHVERQKPDAGCTHNCPNRAHAHVRCKRYSPPDYYAIVKPTNPSAGTA